MKGTAESRAIESNTLTLPVILLASLVLLLAIPQLIRLPYIIVINYNEGWNAFQAARALRWVNIYDPGNALIQNNYPPLSFYIVGALGRLVGDDLMTGRWVSSAALGLTSFNVFWATYGLTRCRSASLLGALFFMACLAGYAPDYVGMNDPQMLAHAWMTGSMALLVHSRRGGRTWMGVAALMVLAGLVKHNLVAFPMAVTVYWAFRDRGLLLPWLGFCLGLVLAACLLLHCCYGSPFFSGVLAGREYSLSKVVEGLREYGPPLLLPVAVWSLSSFGGRNLPENLLILLYALFAAGTGFFFYGGEGVSVNALFDLFIAVSWGVGVSLAGLARAASQGSMSPWSVWGACLLLSLPLLPPLVRAVGEWRDLRGGLQTLEAETLADVSYVRALPGPALCTTLELAYWAGKSFEYDPFNVWQAVQTGRMDEEGVFRKIRNHGYGVVQLESLADGSPEAYPTRLLHQVQRHYVLDRRSVYGFFFVPRALPDGDQRDVP